MTDNWNTPYTRNLYATNLNQTLTANNCRRASLQSLTTSIVGPSYCRAEVYAGCVACCPLVSHVEYASRALLRLEKGDTVDKQTDRRTDRYITLTARCGQRNNTRLNHLRQ